MKREQPTWSPETVKEHFDEAADKYIQEAKWWAEGPLRLSHVSEPRYAGDHQHTGAPLLEALWTLREVAMMQPGCERIPFERVIDFGCGPGINTRLFAVALGVVAYDGVDRTRQTLDQASAWYGHLPNVTYHRADICAPELELPFADLGFTYGVFMHLNPDQAVAAAANIRRLTRFQVIAEKTRLAAKEMDVLAPHVWMHDYPALFGQGRLLFTTRLNEHKDVFVFGDVA